MVGTPAKHCQATLRRHSVLPSRQRRHFCVCWSCCTSSKGPTGLCCATVIALKDGFDGEKNTPWCWPTRPNSTEFPKVRQFRPCFVYLAILSSLVAGLVLRRIRAKRQSLDPLPKAYPSAGKSKVLLLGKVSDHKTEALPSYGLRE